MLSQTVTVHSDPYFVNRSTELSKFRQLLHGSSNLTTIILHGSAGMGKTALLHEFGALCTHESISYVYVDLGRYEFQRSPNYLTIILNLWYQLGIDKIQSPHELIIQEVAPGILRPSGSESYSSDTISGEIVEIEGEAQVAIGKEITQIQNLFIQTETTEETQLLIRTQLTEAFHQHLRKLIEKQPIIFLLDSWDEVVTEQGGLKEIGYWLKEELLDWCRFNNLKNLKSVISCKQDRGLDDIRRQAQIIHLSPLNKSDVQRYVTDRLGDHFANQELQDITNLAQGIPLVMSLMAMGIEQHGSRELLNRSNKPQNDNISESVQFAIEGFLQGLPSRLVGILKIAAIPRRFNRELLAQLYASTSDVDEFIEYIMVYPVASSENRGPLNFVLRQEIRTYLLSQWQQTQQHTHMSADSDYIELNRQAHNYFIQQAKKVSPDSITGYEYRREALYHLYIVDPAAAIEAWAEQFEQAYRNYALGYAESYLDLAHELQHRNLWAKNDSQWLDYFSARLDFFYRRNDYGVETLQQIKGTTVSKTLQARSAWALGNVKLSQQQWSEALVLYRQSLNMLGYSDNPQLRVQFMIAIGNAYYNLAVQRDVVFRDVVRPSRLVMWVVHKIQKAPYIFYNRLVRHVSWLPNWYFGTNYGDWFVAHFLIKATDWYRKAEDQMGKKNYISRSNAPDAILWWDIQMLLASAEHQLGRWQQARQRYDSLIESYTDSEYIHSYRLAQIRLGQGKALIKEKRLEEAHIELSKALARFQKFKSQDGIGHAAVSLGHIERLEARLDEAVKYYLVGMDAFEAAKNNVATTQILSIVGRIELSENISDSLDQQLHTTVAQFQHRHYITYFPGTLIRQFRRLAIWMVLPMTYIATSIVAFSTAIFLFIVGPLPLFIQHLKGADIFILITSAFLPIPFAVWFFHFTYSFIGSLFVHWVGSHLVILDHQQPNHITLDDTGIYYLDASKNIEQTFRWTEIEKVLSIEYLQAQRLLKLISRIVIESKSGEIIVIDAVISNYNLLKKDIKRHLEQVQNQSPFAETRLEFFDPYWILGILAVTTFLIGLRIGDIGAVLYAKGYDESVIARLGSLLIQTFMTIGIFYPTVTLYRFIYNRFTVSKIFSGIRHSIHLWVLYCLTLFFTILTICYVYIFLGTTVQYPVECVQADTPISECSTNGE